MTLSQLVSDRGIDQLSLANPAPSLIGGSAAAAAELVHQLGGNLIGYLFILEISFLKGREKLSGVPIVTLLEEAD